MTSILSQITVKQAYLIKELNVTNNSETGLSHQRDEDDYSLELDDKNSAILN